jgi:hypothetical protein
MLLTKKYLRKKKDEPIIPNVYDASGSIAGGVSNQNSRAESPLPIL